MTRDPFKTEVLVREVMNSPVITVDKDETTDKIAGILKENNIGSVIVMDKDKPIGIITKGDLVYKVIAENKDPKKVRAEEIMTYPIIYVNANDTIQKALKIFRAHKIGKLGVRYKGKLEGILSVNDVLRVIPEILEILSEKVMIKTGLIPVPRAGEPIIGFCDHCGNWSDALKEIDGKFYCPDCIVDLFGEE